MAIGLKPARRLLRYAPVLIPYTLRTYPENLSALADFLDELTTAPAWKEEFDKSLGLARRRKTFDDELENVAIELAGRFRDSLRGVRSQRRSRVKQRFGLEELRIELRAVARDLRIARG